MMTSPAPSATSRALRTANDWWCIRGFILGTYPITPVEFIWENRGWGGLAVPSGATDPCSTSA